MSITSNEYLSLTIREYRSWCSVLSMSWEWELKEVAGVFLFAGGSAATQHYSEMSPHFRSNPA